MKTKIKKAIANLNVLGLQNLQRIKGGDAMAMSKVVTVGNSIVDDLNGLIR